MARLYEILVFGASGYTGKFVLEDLAKKAVVRPGLKIAIAGRNPSLLKSTLEDCFSQTNIPWIEQIPIIEANVTDPESLHRMVKQTRILINCVGPFRLYGEAVVKACIEEGTHYVDVCGETECMERIQLVYHESAKLKKSYIVQSCALISSITELGLQYTEEQFQGQLNEVESFAVKMDKKPYPVHYGTWHSAVYSLSNTKNLKPLRQELYKTKLPGPEPVQQKRGMLFYEPLVNRWCIPFHSSDRAMAYRTQYTLCENKMKDRMIQFEPYMSMPSLVHAAFAVIGMLIFYLFCCFQFTRDLLLKYPHILSFGQVSHQGATREQLEACTFEYLFIGKGWPSSVVDGAPSAQIVTSIQGPEPGYITTSICSVEAACTILDDVDKMPDEGGVYTPGVAFRQTSLLRRMQERLNFSVITKP